MGSINRKFCNLLLQQAVLDLTGRELRHFRANVGCLRIRVSCRTWYLVEWPKMSADGSLYQWEGEADTAAHAKYQAIGHWLKEHAPKVRARYLEEPFPGEEKGSEPQ